MQRMSRQLFFDLLLVVTCAYALCRGGSVERLISATLLSGDLLTIWAASEFQDRFRHLERGIFLVDLAILIVLTAIAMRSTRWWPLLLAGLQLDAVVVHTIRFAAPATVPEAYMDAIALWAYPMQIALAVGAWRHRRRIARDGSDPAWIGRTGWAGS